MMYKNMWFFRPGERLPLPHGPVLMITGPLLALWHWCAAMQPYTWQTAMHRVFWRLSIRTSTSFCSSSSNRSSSVGWSNDPVTGSPLFLLWTTFDRFWPLQTGNKPQQLQFWRISDPDHLAITIWSLSNSLVSLHSAIFPASNKLTFRTKCWLSAEYIPTSNRCHDEEKITVIHFSCQSSWTYAWLTCVYIFNHSHY